MTIVIAIAVAAAIGLMLVSEVNARRQRAEAWASAATQLALSTQPPRLLSLPSIHGRIGEVVVTVDAHEPRWGAREISEIRHRTTRYEVEHRPVGPAVRFSRQGAFNSVARRFGRRDVEVGNPHFDDQIRVDSRAPDEIRAFLTPSRQAAVLAILHGYERAQMTHRLISVETFDIESSAEAIVATVEHLVAIAQIMSEPAKLNAALQLQHDGQLGEAIDELHAINEGQDNVFTKMLEAEALVEHGDHAQAVEVLPEPADGGALAEEVKGWAKLARSPSPIIDSDPPVRSPAGAGGGRLLDQQSVMEDLFASTHMSYETAERFEQSYVNAHVSWNGTVIRVHHYQHDRDFGGGPGQKVTVLLGSADTESVLSTEFLAIIDLGPDVEVAPDEHIGFSGTLLHVDRFARMFYVASGARTS